MSHYAIFTITRGTNYFPRYCLTFFKIYVYFATGLYSAHHLSLLFQPDAAVAASDTACSRCSNEKMSVFTFMNISTGKREAEAYSFEGLPCQLWYVLRMQAAVTTACLF